LENGRLIMDLENGILTVDLAKWDINFGFGKMRY